MISCHPDIHMVYSKKLKMIYGGYYTLLNHCLCQSMFMLIYNRYTVNISVFLILYIFILLVFSLSACFSSGLSHSWKDYHRAAVSAPL